MTELTVGTAVDDLEVLTTGGRRLWGDDTGGRHLVLFFYPRANTPGCTSEARDFRDLHDDFVAAGAVVVGVSRDTPGVQENFKAKLGLPFELVADTDEALCRRFDVIREKNMYGRRVMGVERSTFLLDQGCILRAEWRKVRVKGHAAAVLEALRGL